MNNFMCEASYDLYRHNYTL